MSRDSPEHSITVAYDGDFDFPGLVLTLRDLGREGSSRDVIVQMADHQEENPRFNFDGDGADKILSVEVDGVDALPAEEVGAQLYCDAASGIIMPTEETAAGKKTWWGHATGLGNRSLGPKVGPHKNRKDAVGSTLARHPMARSITTGHGDVGPHHDIRFHDPRDVRRASLAEAGEAEESGDMSIEVAKLEGMLDAEAEMAASWKGLTKTERQAYLTAHPNSKFRTGVHKNVGVDFGSHLEKHGWVRGKKAGTYAHKSNGRTLTIKSTGEHAHHITIAHPNGDVTNRMTNSHRRAANIIRGWGMHKGKSNKPIRRKMMEEKLAARAPMKRAAEKPMEKPARRLGMGGGKAAAKPAMKKMAEKAPAKRAASVVAPAKLAPLKRLAEKAPTKKTPAKAPMKRKSADDF